MLRVSIDIDDLNVEGLDTFVAEIEGSSLQSYCRSWTCTGPLIEKYKIDVGYIGGGNSTSSAIAAALGQQPDQWTATLDDCSAYAVEPLIAVARVIVQSQHPSAVVAINSDEACRLVSDQWPLVRYVIDDGEHHTSREDPDDRDIYLCESRATASSDDFACVHRLATQLRGLQIIDAKYESNVVRSFVVRHVP